MKKTIFGIAVTLLLTSMLMSALAIREVKASKPPATEWTRTYGGANDDSSGRSVFTADGGYAIIGSTKSFGAGNADAWLVKTDESGNMEWNKTYGGTGEDHAYFMVKTSDGGYAMTGLTWSYGEGIRDAWLVKTDGSGNMEWNKTYGGTGSDRGHALVQTSDGGYVIAGMTRSFGAGAYDFWLIKTDSAGNMEWDKTYGGTNEDHANFLVQTSDGGYAIGGYTQSFGEGGWDCWLVKTDENGNMEWNKTYGGTNDDHAYSFVQTNDGGYALSCGTYSFGEGSRDAWLVKTDENGNMEWNKTYGGTNDDWVTGVLIASDSGYAMAGGTSSYGMGSYDCWLVRTDENGNMEWNKTYGGTNDDRAYNLIVAEDGGYLILGTTLSFGAGMADSWLIKLEAEPEPPSIQVFVDIKPGSWPNPLNKRSRGRIAVAICGTEELDAATIDPETVEITREGFEIGVPPLKWSFEDVATPYTGPQGGGHALGGDGYLDLVLHFSTQEVVTLLELCDFDSGTTILLEITGSLRQEHDGTPIQGTDTILIIAPNGRGGPGRYGKMT